MNPINKNALRAAVLIHEHWRDGQTPGCVPLHLPEYSWNNLQRLRRRIELARQRGWHAAADRLTEDLASRVGRLSSRTGKRPSRPAKSPDAATGFLRVDIYRDIVGLCRRVRGGGHRLGRARDFGHHRPHRVGGNSASGAFEIRLDWRLSGLVHTAYRVVALDPNPAAASDDVTHPHVQNEQLCEGEGRAAIRAALAECRFTISSCSFPNCSTPTAKAVPTSS